jgi:hypothetical protein
MRNFQPYDLSKDSLDDLFTANLWDGKCKTSNQTSRDKNRTLLDEILYESTCPIPPVHLIRKNVRRNSVVHRGSALNEPGQPKRLSEVDPMSRTIFS